MTYRELLNRLRYLSDEQLNTDITVYVQGEDEYYPARLLIDHDSEGVLDSNHPVLAVED